MGVDNMDIYIGNLKKCVTYKKERIFKKEDGYGMDNFVVVEYEEKIYKEDANLLKLSNEHYVDLDSPHAFEIILKIHMNKEIIVKKNDFLTPTKASKEGDIFVDENSLVKVLKNNSNEKVLTKRH